MEVCENEEHNIVRRVDKCVVDFTDGRRCRPTCTTGCTTRESNFYTTYCLQKGVKDTCLKLC
jgi:hypothetical protein